jgi:hypothetical protein
LEIATTMNKQVRVCVMWRRIHACQRRRRTGDSDRHE